MSAVELNVRKVFQNIKKDDQFHSYWLLTKMENDQKPSRVWANKVQNVKKFEIK